MSQKHRVLVVDDEGIQLALEELLDSEGYEVLVASDGREALDALKTWSPEAIVLDLMMPVMDGWAFREAQRQLVDGLDAIPVIVLSGALDLGEYAEAVGVAAVIPKPFDLNEVVTAVERAIRG